MPEERVKFDSAIEAASYLFHSVGLVQAEQQGGYLVLDLTISQAKAFATAKQYGFSDVDAAEYLIDIVGDAKRIKTLSAVSDWIISLYFDFSVYYRLPTNAERLLLYLAKKREQIVTMIRTLYGGTKEMASNAYDDVVRICLCVFHDIAGVVWFDDIHENEDVHARIRFLSRRCAIEEAV